MPSRCSFPKCMFRLLLTPFGAASARWSPVWWTASIAVSACSSAAMTAILAPSVFSAASKIDWATASSSPAGRLASCSHDPTARCIATPSSPALSRVLRTRTGCIAEAFVIEKLQNSENLRRKGGWRCRRAPDRHDPAGAVRRVGHLALPVHDTGSLSTVSDTASIRLSVVPT